MNNPSSAVDSDADSITSAPNRPWFPLVLRTMFVVVWIAFGLTALIGTFVYWNLKCFLMLMAMCIFGVVCGDYDEFRYGQKRYAYALLCLTLPAILLFGVAVWKYFS